MSAPIYHYTDTARLPWILLDGALKPGRNRIGGFPDPDFLWATTSSLGDRTASGTMQAVRQGRTRLVRFILPADAFLTWPEVVAAYPTWTPEHVARLERAALGQSRPVDWRCRVAPLEAEAWLGIETRSYTDKVWRPLDLEQPPEVFAPDRIGVWIENKVYVSQQMVGPQGQDAYAVSVGTRRAA